MIKSTNLQEARRELARKNVRLFKECDEDVEKAEHNPG